MMKTAAILAGALAIAAGSANGAITFSFADPAPGKQLTHTAGTGISYDTSNTTGVIRFIVGSNDGSLPTTIFANARMEMDVAIGTATPIPGGFTAPIAGTFTIYDLDITNTIRTDILRASFGRGGGTAVVFGPSGALITNSVSPNDLAYTAGPALQALLPLGTFIAPVFDAVFTLTDLDFRGGAPLGPNNQVNSFDANASYSGTANLIPAPGALALVGLGGLVGLRRRR